MDSAEMMLKVAVAIATGFFASLGVRPLPIP